MTDRRSVAKNDIYNRLFKTNRDNENNNNIFDLQSIELGLQNKLKKYPPLKTKLDELIKDKEEIIKETSALQSNAKKSMQFHLNQIDKLKEKNAELREKNNQSDKEYSNLRERRDNTIKLIEEQNKELGSIRNKIEEIYSQLEKDNNDKYYLLKAKNTFNKSKLEKRAQKKIYIEENKKLAYECKFKNDLLKKSQRENEELNNEFTVVTNELLVLREEIDNNIIEMQTVNDFNAQLKAKLSDIEGELKCLTIESANMKERISKEQNSNMIEGNKTNKLNTMIMNKDKEINVLKCQLDHECNYSKIINNDIQRFLLEKNKLEDYIAKLEKNNAVLNQEIKDITYRSYIEDQKSQNSLQLTDLYSENRSYLNESLKGFTPEGKHEAYEITVHNLHKGE